MNLLPLFTFIKARVVEALVTAQESAARQPITLGGDSLDDSLVTELPTQPSARGETTRFLWRSGPTLPPDPYTVLEAVASEAASAQSHAVSGLLEHASFTDPREQWADDYDQTRDVFGSENASYMWMRGLRLVAASDGRTVEDRDAVYVHRVEHDGSDPLSPGHWRVHLTVEHDDPIGHCLELKDREGNVWTTVLPTFVETPRPLYQVEFELEYDPLGGTRALTRLESSLVDESGVVADVWRLYRFGRLDTLLQGLRAFLDARRADLDETPFAAVLGGLIALRLGDSDLADAMASVAQERVGEVHPDVIPGWTSDWTALMAGYIARVHDPASDAPPTADIGRLVLSVGIPRTSLGVLTAHTAVRTMLRMGDRLSSDHVATLRAAHKQLTAALDGLAGAGMFATYAHQSASDVVTTFGPSGAQGTRTKTMADPVAAAEAYEIKTTTSS